MDPLSICASALALIGASKAVTKALYSFTRYATHAETHVASLCSEITTLTEYLSSINTTLKSCRRNARSFALIEAELWCQSDLALQDCEATLNELSAFVARLKPSNDNNKTAFWRAKVAVDMSIHARQLEQFRARLQRSNYALQTVLQTITVSVSLQNNASHDRLMLELDKLKMYIEHAVCIGARSPVGTHRQPSSTTLSETIAAKHLQGLVKAAESFYSSATTTVGSSFGGSVADWPPPARETIPGLSPFRTQRVHEYIQSTSQRLNPLAATEAKDLHEDFIADESAELTDDPAKPVTRTPDADFKLPFVEDFEYFDIEKTMVEVREDFAVEKMKDRDFEGAATFLNEALSKIELVCETQVRVRLQTRLGMCYVLQRKTHEARKVVSELERNGGLENREVLHLMHALAMLHLAQCQLGPADNLGNRIVNAKMRLLGKSHPETLISLGFLEHLYYRFSMLLRLEAIRRHIPPDYVYSHPESELDFLSQHAMLMPTMTLETDKVELPGTSLSEDSQSGSAQTPEKEYTRNPGVKRALTRYERQPTDTMKAFHLAVLEPSSAAQAAGCIGKSIGKFEYSTTQNGTAQGTAGKADGVGRVHRTGQGKEVSQHDQEGSADSSCARGEVPSRV
ncbi:hypothetical protein ISF_07875 [Cordyceps fumosorosea ARSEF 2679]|uniref:Fungal N-terminal domain-containing protein n=1 Tax=Cordyceps fumosorosea (strain ARSEF 2679) TaxID=1081104 RepID=A0A167NBP7_CORFA|nr:hypothetical protein ISF_07875 [Cordyceps fumosorosea ARSEF 2679]OAA55364.1 hypothetical protein ISF_07875 [Cordyceps fumosorosea ARSEF 2679]